MGSCYLPSGKYAAFFASPISARIRRRFGAAYFCAHTAARGAIRPAGKYAPLFAMTPSNIASKRPTGALHHRFIIEQTAFRRPSGRIDRCIKTKRPTGALHHRFIVERTASAPVRASIVASSSNPSSRSFCFTDLPSSAASMPMAQARS